MNYHAKFEGPRLKSDVYSKVPRPLDATPLLKFFRQFLRGVNMNFHAKSGASSLKIDQIMLNLVFGGHFVFGRPFCFFGGHFFTIICRGST